MISFIEVSGNAFIELANHNKQMILTTQQICSYANMVGKKMNTKYIGINGYDLFNIEYSYSDIMKLSRDKKVLEVCKGVSKTILEEMFRSKLTSEELNAYKSPEALKELGISQGRTV